jgi:hypothetical protein
MSMDERTGDRDLLYSGWHRPKRIRRFLDLRDAHSLVVIDIDYCEACHVCYQPLALIETQRSAHLPKQAPIMAKLAHLAGIPAWSVSYQPNDAGDDIEIFRVRQIEPFDEESFTMSPEIYAKWLLNLRAAHACTPRS